LLAGIVGEIIFTLLELEYRLIERLDYLIRNLPTASVKNIKVSKSHRSSVCLVWQVSWSFGEGGHAPVKVFCSGSVSPATSISVKAALSPYDYSRLRNCLTHSIIESHIIHSNVPTCTVVAPYALDNDLKPSTSINTTLSTK
jgi:hypothetical protein